MLIEEHTCSIVNRKEQLNPKLLGELTHSFVWTAHVSEKALSYLTIAELLTLFNSMDTSQMETAEFRENMQNLINRKVVDKVCGAVSSVDLPVILRDYI